LTHDAQVFLHSCVDELVCTLGSPYSIADHLCLKHGILSHPQRLLFLRVVEMRQPHLVSVLDLMLHIFTGREVEAMMTLQPEGIPLGSFSRHEAPNGAVYFYHSGFHMSQWHEPAEVCSV
jgi:hypothetical protein